ncbi:hypothetical protein AVEN_216216-1, partial [Araneus ventricosus]
TEMLQRRTQFSDTFCSGSTEMDERTSPINSSSSSSVAGLFRETVSFSVTPQEIVSGRPIHASSS